MSHPDAPPNAVESSTDDELADEFSPGEAGPADAVSVDSPSDGAPVVAPDLPKDQPANGEPANHELANDELANDELANDELAEHESATEDLAEDESEAGASEPVALPGPDLDDPQVLVAAIEAILFVAEAPVASAQLAVALQRPTAEVDDALARLEARLEERGSGIELRSIAGGHRLYTRPAFSPVIEGFLLEGQRSKLSQAALETLAVVAYRQPVTRARISAIRGVNVDGVVRTLVTRGLIVEAGNDPETGGGVYRTTEIFLERLGLKSIGELPSLAPLLPELDMLESDEL
ncbi:segregation and condensation protein B [Frankineae bacterium MT45]|nr:segregation and condensation protein B [Frankineae bacterium MT45]